MTIGYDYYFSDTIFGVSYLEREQFKSCGYITKHCTPGCSDEFKFAKDNTDFFK